MSNHSKVFCDRGKCKYWCSTFFCHPRMVEHLALNEKVVRSTTYPRFNGQKKTEDEKAMGESS